MSGSNNTGTITIFGDNKTADGEGFQEDEFGDNQYDGDDTIILGDGNTANTIVYGQGGNDKIYGGVNEKDLLYGGSGDDKIWLVSPAVRSLDNNTALANLALGGQGNDKIYGSDGLDVIAGDDELRVK